MRPRSPPTTQDPQRPEFVRHVQIPTCPIPTWAKRRSSVNLKEGRRQVWVIPRGKIDRYCPYFLGFLLFFAVSPIFFGLFQVGSNQLSLYSKISPTGSPGRWPPDVSPTVYVWDFLTLCGGERGSLRYLPRVWGSKIMELSKRQLLSPFFRENGGTLNNQPHIQIGYLLGIFPF